MDNARRALTGDAERAFLQVVDHYLRPLGLKAPPVSGIFRIFHFVEAKRWHYYLRHVARFDVTATQAPNVEGVTHSYENDPKIGINKCYHTQATLVHESIHFFSSYAFRRAFHVDINEGATEYLTRIILNDQGPRRDINGNGDLYKNEFALFNTMIHNEADHEVLNKAYFLGDQQAISLLDQLITTTNENR